MPITTGVRAAVGIWWVEAWDAAELCKVLRNVRVLRQSDLAASSVVHPAIEKPLEAGRLRGLLGYWGSFAE